MKKFYIILSVCVSLSILGSCVEELKTENFYTFTGETIADYVESRESLSMFKEILQRTSEPCMINLLDAYGQYTCFAPSNAAIENYLAERGLTEVSQLSVGECDTIAKNHVIKVAYLTTNMPEGTLGRPNMNERYIQIFVESGDILVNKDALVLVRDEEVENGVVHVVDKVLQHSNAMIVDMMHHDSRISLFYEAVVLTGFDKQLAAYIDPEFEKIRRADGMGDGTDRTGQPKYFPTNRYLGYTAFIETNEVLEKAITEAGIEDTSIKGLIAYAKSIYELEGEVPGTFFNNKGLYGEEEYTNPKHPLYRFVAYHFLNRKINTDKMTTYFHFVQESHDAFDFYETMCKGTILKVSRGAKTGNQTHLNRRCRETCAKCGDSHGPEKNEEGVPVVEKEMYDGSNGIYYLIGAPLIYSKDVVVDVVLKDRMRFDAATLMPELATNNIFRNGDGTEDAGTRGLAYQIPNTKEYSYVENLKIYQEAVVYYQCPVRHFWCWYADEIIAEGSYDFAIKLPPVPSGTYEIRYGYVPMSHRGVVQVYLEWDNTSKPCGIPIDLTMDGKNAKIGWVDDRNMSDEEKLKVDKAMHNRGYLMGPMTQVEGGDDPDEKNNHNTQNKDKVARLMSNHLRRIVATEYLDNSKDYYIRFRSVDETAKEFMFDYLELCPKEIYDNPNLQEDRL